MFNSGKGQLLPGCRDGLLVELDDPSLDEVPDAMVGVLHLRDLVHQGLDGRFRQRGFSARCQIVIDILHNLGKKFHFCSGQFSPGLVVMCSTTVLPLLARKIIILLVRELNCETFYGRNETVVCTVKIL